MHEVINNPNLDVILHLDLRYMDFSQIRTSFEYLSRLKKNVFEMICQLSLPTFFVAFISVESKWPHFIMMFVGF